MPESVLTKEQFDQYGLRLFSRPASDNPSQVNYLLGSSQGIHRVDTNLAQQLASIGVQANRFRGDENTEQLGGLYPGINFNTSGLADLNSFQSIDERYGAQYRNRTAQQQEEQQAASLNQFIAQNQGTQGIIPVPMRPGYVIENGVFKMASQATTPINQTLGVKYDTNMTPTTPTSAPASTQGLYKVQIPGTGPNGLPLYDIYGPQGKIDGSNPAIFQPGGTLYGINLYNLPSGSPATRQGFVPSGYSTPVSNQFSISPTPSNTPLVSGGFGGTSNASQSFGQTSGRAAPTPAQAGPFTSAQANYQSQTGEAYYIAPGVDPRRESNYYKANDSTGQTNIYQSWDGAPISQTEFQSRGLNETWINWQGTKGGILDKLALRVSVPNILGGSGVRQEVVAEGIGTPDITGDDFTATTEAEGIGIQRPGLYYLDPNAPKSAVQDEINRRIADAQAYNARQKEQKNAETLAQNPNTPTNNNGDVILQQDYIIENSEYQKKILELVNKTLSSDIDLDKILKTLQDQEGLSTINSEIRTLKDEAAILNNSFRTIQDEIRNDPDFTQKLKGKRGKFIEDEQLRQLQLYEDKIKNLQELKSEKEKLVTERFGTYTQEIQLETTRTNMLIGALDGLQDREDDKAKAAKDAINGLMEHPELSKGITDSEVQFVSRNGYYPASLIKRIGDNFGTKIKTMFSVTSGTREQQWVITEDGKYRLLVEGAPKPTSGGGVNISYQTADGRRVEIIRDNQGNLISSTDIGSSGETTNVDLRSQFLSWLPTVAGQFSPQQLQSAASFVGNIDVTKDTTLNKAIGQYSTQDPSRWYNPISWFSGPTSGDADPIRSFNSFRNVGGSTGGSTIKNPQTGRSHPVSGYTPQEIELMKSEGWILQ